MDIDQLSRKRYLHTMLWAIVFSLGIVVIAAGLGRATMNVTAALTDKPDIALYLLLEEKGFENLGESELLHTKMDEVDREIEKHYTVKVGEQETYLVILKLGDMEWYVSDVEILHVEE